MATRTPKTASTCPGQLHPSGSCRSLGWLLIGQRRGPSADAWSRSARVPLHNASRAPCWRATQGHIRSGHLLPLAVGADRRYPNAKVGGHVAGGPPLGCRIGLQSHVLSLPYSATITLVSNAALDVQTMSAGWAVYALTGLPSRARWPKDLRPLGESIRRYTMSNRHSALIVFSRPRLDAIARTLGTPR
jgi:hypothetical protein